MDQDMSKDIFRILEGWEYQPEQLTVRRTMGLDGEWKIQMRLDLGLLQMNVHGRPDGSRPFGHESLLEYYQSQANRWFQDIGKDTFELSEDACNQLRREGVQYYHRYLCLFRLGDYRLVQRDTRRNLVVADFVKQYASAERAAEFDTYRPYVLLMNTRARASAALVEKDYTRAIREIEQGISQIQNYYQEGAHSVSTEDSTEVRFLNDWLEQIKEERPLTQTEQLKLELEQAVANEKYEQAAVLRDRLIFLLEKDS